MRILSFCPRYLPVLSGGETAAHGLHRALVARGHQVSVVTATQAEDHRARKVVDGVEVFHGRIRPAHARYLEELHPDVLLAQFEQAAPAVRFAAEAGLPVVVSCHGPYGYTELAEAGLAQAVDLFIFNSAFLRNLANRNVHHVIVSPPIDRERVRAPESTEPRFAATLINLFENKGPHVLYELARRYPKQQFLGVRGGYGTQDERDLPNVTLIDPTPDLGRVYGASRVVLMPSAEESFGMVGLEAQSNGVPVIASDLPSLRESLGTGALFLRRDDLDGWADALRLLADDCTYDELSRRARENIERFDLERDVAELESALDGILRRWRWRRRPSLRRLAEEREERERRIREVFWRAAARAPSRLELSALLDGPHTMAALEHMVPQMIGGAA